jgi:aminopeptidase
MAIKDFDKKLARYADLIVHVGLNLQKGQNLAIGGKNLTRGAPLTSAPLVRKVAESAYKAGAHLVSTLWDDDQVNLIRFKHADPNSFAAYPHWRTDAIYEHAKNGDAIFTVHAENPDVYKSVDPDLVVEAQRTMEQHLSPASMLLMKNAYNWCLVSTPTPQWAHKIFPKLSEQKAMEKLWDVIFTLCRVDKADPVKAWEKHIAGLNARAAYMNAKGYDSLHYTGPGTDFTLGLPANHEWNSAQGTVLGKDFKFIPNLPTEEIFTMPHKSRAEGTVKATMPLAHAGRVMDGFSLTFKAGRVVDFKAKTGADMLQRILDTDEGARQLGEVALVPHSSPISQSGLLFYNTLFDENAASHIALGRAYQESLKDGEEMDTEAFYAAGGNNSLIHIDFMIGSEKLDIDGLSKSGKAEPVMRKGEWAFKF